jgi:hypothetical protein
MDGRTCSPSNYGRITKLCHWLVPREGRWARSPPRRWPGPPHARSELLACVDSDKGPHAAAWLPPTPCLFTPHQIELFSAVPVAYYGNAVIETGPAHFSAKLTLAASAGARLPSNLPKRITERSYYSIILYCILC